MRRLTNGGGRRDFEITTNVTKPVRPHQSLKETNPVQYQTLSNIYKEELAEYRDKTAQEQLDNAERYLTMSGTNLINAARIAGLDPTKSTKELQTELFTSAVANATSKLPAQNHGYTNAEIIALKKRFLSVLKKTPFIGVSASTVGLSEKLIQSWIRTDADFAFEVYESQKLVMESVAGALIKRAIKDDDVSAMMFLARQYGAAFSQTLLQTLTGAEKIADAQDAEGMPSIENLTPDEQLMFLNLVRKAKNPQKVDEVLSYAPTQFIEEEEEEDDL